MKENSSEEFDFNLDELIAKSKEITPSSEEDTASPKDKDIIDKPNSFNQKIFEREELTIARKKIEEIKQNNA